MAPRISGHCDLNQCYAGWQLVTMKGNGILSRKISLMHSRLKTVIRNTVTDKTIES